MEFRYSRFKYYGSENNTGYNFVFVIIGNFIKFGWTVSLKNKKAQSITNSFENIVISKRKPKLIRSDRGKEFFKYFFQKFVNNNNNKHYSRNRSLGAVFAERFNFIIRILLKRPVFERGDGNWIDILSTITIQYNNRVHSSNKFTPIQASLKQNEGSVFLIYGKKLKPKFQVNDLLRTAYLKKKLKGDLTNWFYECYKISEKINGTGPTYHIDDLS